MKNSHLLVSVILLAVVFLHPDFTFGQNEKNSIIFELSNKTQILKFSNEQYPINGKTGGAVMPSKDFGWI